MAADQCLADVMHKALIQCGESIVSPNVGW
jgi:hypothetical protein